MLSPSKLVALAYDGLVGHSRVEVRQGDDEPPHHHRSGSPMRCSQREASGHFVGHRGEHLRRVRPARDQGCHPTQGRLLPGEGLAAFGYVAANGVEQATMPNDAPFEPTLRTVPADHTILETHRLSTAGQTDQARPARDLDLPQRIDRRKAVMPSRRMSSPVSGLKAGLIRTSLVRARDAPADREKGMKNRSPTRARPASTFATNATTTKIPITNRSGARKRRNRRPANGGNRRTQWR